MPKGSFIQMIFGANQKFYATILAQGIDFLLFFCYNKEDKVF